MAHRRITTLILALTFIACKGGDQGAELPPASGPGSAPRAALPELGSKGLSPVATIATVTSETTGTTFPSAQAAVAPKMTGIIDKILVKEGDRVTRRTVLFRLRTQDVSLRVNQAKAGLQGAKVRLAAVKVEYDRTKRLLDNNAINRMAWDRVQAEYNGAVVGVTAAKAGLRMAQQGWSDAVVRSPINGIVTRKLKNEGELATMMPPSVIVIVEDHSTLELKFRLPETALRTLAVGDMYKAEFTAIGVTKNAKVVRIAPNVDVRTRTVEVVANIDNRSGKLKSGMLAKVDRVDAAPPARIDAGATK